jgi:hypothetical protein
MDMQQGMLCELTNVKADFDGTCPNYDEDAKEKAKNERIEKEFQETLTVSGWLAFFLWVGVGLGAMFSCLFIIPILVDLGFTFTMLLASLSVVCLMITAILTIKAFYQKAPNAVALAMTYIAMIALDELAWIAFCIILDDTTLLYVAARSLIWALIWLSYLLMSDHVENMIPRSTRTWKMTEKILLALYALSYFLIILIPL